MGFKLFLILEKFLMVLPSKARKNFFIFLAKTAYLLSSRYRNIGFINLDFVYGEKLSRKEKKDIVKYSFKNLLLNFLHLMEIRHMSLDEFKKKVTVKNLHVVRKVHEEGRAVVYITPHYCSWEFAGLAVGVFIEPLSAIYRKMKNKDYEKWVLESRCVFGNSSLEKTNVIKPMIKLIKEGKASGILIDTSVNKREGIEVELLGQKTHQTPAPAYLARKYDAAIIPVVIETDDEEHYTLRLFEEIVVPKSGDEKDDIHKGTQAQADWLSELITKEPKFWFWIHRRFKSDHPHIYKKKP